MVDNVSKYLEENKEKYVNLLTDWLRIPSISTLSEYAESIHEAAEWAQKRLREIGFPKVELIEGEGHPIVYAEWLVHKNQPTILIYGHYDVQPVDPLKEWKSDPFEPRIANNNIYARGAVDDKGQVMLVLAALDAWVKVNGALPVNVKVLLEGEEEAGGVLVDKYVHDHAEELAADSALICDTRMIGADQPSITCGLRGIQYTEIAVSGPKSDLHSGGYGGVAPNPIHALCLLIARLKGEDGKINVPGIYSSPVDVSTEERAFWLENEESLTSNLHKEMGVERLYGENHILPHERLGIRPTLEVHGIRGGFTDEGAKTVIPAQAVAKVSLRLPAGMQPKMVFEIFKQAVHENMPEGYSFEVRDLHGGAGTTINPENKYFQTAVSAIENAYGKRPVYMREGGSIPIASLFDSILGIPVVLMGFGLPDDGVHGPNEKFSLSQFYKGMTTVADYLGRLQH